MGDEGPPRAVRDPRTTEALVCVYLDAPDHDDRASVLDEGSRALLELHTRGGPAELDAGRRLTQSAVASERIAGANILAQLGGDARTHLDETVQVLLGLLGDASDDVVAAAAIALGHRRDPSAVAPLVGLARHPSGAVRLGVVHGLSCHEDTATTATLVSLARDVDREVRSWAAFGLSQRAADAPEIREALCACAKDDDPEVRGEALIGLARRRDARVRPWVRAELRGEFHGDWVVEAAALLAEPELVTALEELRERLDAATQRRFARSFTDALAACRAGV